MREAPNFFKTFIENPDNNPDRQEGGRYDGAIKIKDGLIPEETVYKTQFNEEQLAEIFSLKEIYHEQVQKDGTSVSKSKINIFVQNLVDKYGIDTIKNCGAYYILIGKEIEDIPKDVDRVDLSDNDFGQFIMRGFSLEEDIS
jgi:hypothetical protein